MKKVFLILFIFGSYLSGSGQELMTIGKVYDFNPGDEFQITGTADNQPPNADRITIVGKYYSRNADTLFYVRFHNSYYTEVIWDSNPYLEYHFWTQKDTVAYTNLDSSLVYFDQGFEINQYIEYSDDLCGSLINGCAYESGPGFEDDYIVNEYGKGLGQTYAYYYANQAHAVLWANTLFYYKKGDFECGIPDTATVGINEINDQQLKFTIYPNPVHSFINIRIESHSGPYQCVILNLKGEIVLSEILQNQRNRIKTDFLDVGIYIIQINYGSHRITRKFIKK